MYHDIGKGRGGDHSELGAVDAQAFCKRHQLSEADTELVCWLVEKHLYMSTVSQREDIYDPEVVFNFASVVKSEMRLDYLYALTVADINATNPTLWNSWRATLLRQLYGETRRVLRRGLESVADRQATIAAYQERAMDRLMSQQKTLEPERIASIWEDLGEDFFLRHSPPQIARLTAEIAAHDCREPFVHIEDIRGDSQGEGATCCYVYTEDKPHLFASTVLALGKFDLSVVAATVNTGPGGQCFDTYTVLNADGEPVERNKELRAQIAAQLKSAVSNSDIAPPRATRRLSRQLRELPWATEVQIAPAATGDATVLTILANDRPGLLATIALLFIEFNLQLVSAKITTLGERVEDTFVVVDNENRPIAAGEASYNIQQAIRQRLDQAMSQL
jgi:[protein-PII] uridylyltransferase